MKTDLNNLLREKGTNLFFMENATTAFKVSMKKDKKEKQLSESSLSCFSKKQSTQFASLF